MKKTYLFASIIAAAALTACSDEPSESADAAVGEDAAAPASSSAPDVDLVLSRTEAKFDDSGKVVETITYSDPGPDGLWFTADDIAER